MNVYIVNSTLEFLCMVVCGFFLCVINIIIIFVSSHNNIYNSFRWVDPIDSEIRISGLVYSHNIIVVIYSKVHT